MFNARGRPLAPALTALIAILYGSNWNRLPGGFPAWYSNNFTRGTEVSLQTLRMFISSVGESHSLLESQVTCTQVVFFSQEHTFTSCPAVIHQMGLNIGARFVLTIF